MRVLYGVFVLFSFSVFGTDMRVPNAELLESARLGDLDRALLALLAKADINTKGFYGQTPLHIAASRGDKRMVKFLLQNQADVHAKDTKKRRPIDCAKTYKFKWVAKFNKNNCDQVLEFCQKKTVQAQSFLAEQREACKHLRNKEYAAQDLINLLSNAAWNRYVNLPGPSAH